MAIQFLPIIIGALATGAGVAINQNEVRRANKRAQAANETLRINKERFEKQANENLLTTVKGFSSQDREDRHQQAVDQGEELLANTLGRNREAFSPDPVGNVSSQFIDSRAGTQQNLDDRASRKALNLAKVTAPGRTGFQENRNLLRSGQRENTIRTLERDQLGVDALKVDEAGRVKANFLGDLLTGVGPALITGGALGAFGGAGAASGIGSAATSQSILAPSAAVSSVVGSGTTGVGTGLAGVPLLASSLGPRRGFSRAN